MDKNRWRSMIFQSMHIVAQAPLRGWIQAWIQAWIEGDRYLGPAILLS